MVVIHQRGARFYKRKDLDTFRSLTNGPGKSGMLINMELCDPLDHVLILKDKKQILGWCLITKTWGGFYPSHNWYLSFYIDPVHRGKHLSTYLVNAIPKVIKTNKVLGYKKAAVGKMMKAYPKGHVDIYGWDSYKIH